MITNKIISHENIFVKSLIKRRESSSLEFLSVRTLSNIFNGCMFFFSLRPDNRIGNMPAFSINENNKSLLFNCRAKKMHEVVNKQVKILTTQYINACNSAYTKGYAIN